MKIITLYAEKHDGDLWQVLSRQADRLDREMRAICAVQTVTAISDEMQDVNPAARSADRSEQGIPAVGRDRSTRWRRRCVEDSLGGDRAQSGPGR